MRKVLTFLGIFLLSFLLLACEKPTDKFFEVEFNVAGGLPLIDSQVIENGKLATEPTIIPEKDGFVFEYWQLDGEKFLFTTEITSNITLVAKWKEAEKEPTITDPTVIPPSTTPSDVEKVMVQYRGLDYYVNPTVLDKGSSLSRPEDPYQEGHIFLGWFLDERGTNEAVFPLVVNEDLILYASWEKIVHNLDYVFDQGDTETIYYVQALVVSGAYSTTGALNMVFIQDVESGNMYEVEGLNVFGSHINKGDLICFDAEFRIETEAPQQGRKSLFYNSGLVVVEENQQLHNYREDAIIITSHQDMLDAFDTGNPEYGKVYFFTNGFYYSSNWLSYQPGGNQNARIHMDPTASKADDIRFDGRLIVINDNGNRANLGENWFEEILNMGPDNYPGTTLPGRYYNGGFYAVFKNSTASFHYLSVLSPEDFVETATVEFDLGFASDTEIPAQHLLKGDLSEEPAAPTREGYDFVGWFLNLEDEQPFDFTAPVLENTKLFAKWERDATAETVVVTFDINYLDGINPVEQLLEKGEVATKPEIAERENATFVGWFLDLEDEQPFDFTSTIEADIKLYAKWQKEILSVADAYLEPSGSKFNIEGIIISGGYTTGAALQNIFLQDKETGKIIIVLDLVGLNDTFAIGDLVVFYGQKTVFDDEHENGKVTIDFLLDLEVISSNNEILDYKNNAIEITSHEDMLHHFHKDNVEYGAVYYFSNGFYYNSNWLNYQTSGNQNARIHMNPTANNKDGITYGERTVVLNDNNNRPNLGNDWYEKYLNITPENYPGTSYPGFYKYGGFYAVLKNATGSFYFLSIISEDDFEDYVDVSLDLGYDDVVEKQKITLGNLAVMPETPERSGYIFEGWYLDLEDETTFDFTTPITQPITLYAKWSEDQTTTYYTVEYYYAYGEEGLYKEELVEAGSLAEVPKVPFRAGHEFVGWFLELTDEQPFDFTSSINSDLNLYAKWSKFETMSVEEVLTSGEVGSTLAVEGIVLSGTYATNKSLYGLFIQDTVTGRIIILKDIIGFEEDFNIGDLISFKAELVVETSADEAGKKYLSYKDHFLLEQKEAGVVDYKQNAITLTTQQQLHDAFLPENIVYGQVYLVRGEIYYNSNWANFQTTGNHHMRINFDTSFTTNVQKQVGNGKYLALNDNANRKNLGDNWFEEVLGITPANFPGTRLPGFNFTGDIYIILLRSDGSSSYASILSRDDFIEKEIVKFVTDSEDTVENQFILAGEVAVIPTEPSKVGYIFDGWYLDLEDETAFDFATPITGETVLYAKWIKDISATFYDYEFHYGFVEAGIYLEGIVEEGLLLEVPTSPVRAGYEFVGWFLDLQDEQPFDFTTSIYADVKLYAKWEKVIVSVEEAHLSSQGDTYFLEAIVLSGGYAGNGSFQNLFVQDKDSGKIAIVIGLTDLGTTHEIGDLVQILVTKTISTTNDENGKVTYTFNDEIEIISSNNEIVDYKTNAVKIGSQEDMITHFTSENIIFGQVYYFTNGFYYNSNYTGYQTSGNQNSRIHMNPSANNKDSISYGGRIVVLNDNNQRVNLGNDWYETFLGITPTNYPGTKYPGFYKNGGFYAVLKNATASFYFLSIISPDDLEEYVDVSFDLGHDDLVEVQKIFLDEVVAEPAVPERMGYEFVGWFLDLEDEQPFDFSTTISEDLVLKAKWTENI